jgi:hypothetical protein
MQFDTSIERVEPYVRAKGTQKSTVIGVMVTVFFVGTYLYNTVRFDKDTLRGDQWYWVRNVLIPFEEGRLSFFDAITTEYANLSHSHVPTLIVFITNARILDLDLTVDALVGTFSLLAVLCIVFRHASVSQPGVDPWVVTAAASSLLFMSSSYGNFVWSLLQFQMFYVLVAVWYLYRFGKQVESPTAFHALVVVPAAIVLGDAIGVAAVLSSLVYLTISMVLRRTPVRNGVLHLAALPIQLFVLGALLTGTRTHGELPWGSFLDLVRDRPAEVAATVRDAIAAGLVGYRDNPTSGLGILSWDLAWYGFAVTLVLALAATLGLVRSGIEQRDHFPLMLIGATAIWSAGVIRSRFWLFGPNAMHADRYAAYTTLLGLGLIVLLAGRWSILGRWRLVVGATVSIVVMLSAVGTLAVTVEDVGERAQEAELASLRDFVEGSIDVPVQGGLQCKVRTPCLEAAWFLWDRGLGPFSGQPSGAPEWVPVFRSAVYAGLRAMDPTQLSEHCSWLSGATDDDVAQVIATSGPGTITEFMNARDASLPGDAIADAVVIYRRAVHVECQAITPVL